jgi:hypothetical protein
MTTTTAITIQQNKETLETSQRKNGRTKVFPALDKEVEKVEWEEHFPDLKENMLASICACLQEQKESDEEVMIDGLSSPQMALPSAIDPSFSLSPTSIDPQVLELFDTMIDSLVRIDASGIAETTITLDSPQFASSQFYGTVITIQEYDTAPKSFNIHLKASAEATALFQSHAADLMAIFQNDRFAFKVNRLETHLKDDRSPSFKRKEEVSEDKDEHDSL